VSSTSISAALARFTTNLRLDDVPQAVRERAKHLILDSIGLAFATTTFNYSRATLAAMQELDSGTRRCSRIRSGLPCATQCFSTAF